MITRHKVVLVVCKTHMLMTFSLLFLMMRYVNICHWLSIVLSWDTALCFSYFLLMRFFLFVARHVWIQLGNTRLVIEIFQTSNNDMTLLGKSYLTYFGGPKYLWRKRTMWTSWLTHMKGDRHLGQRMFWCTGLYDENMHVWTWQYFSTGGT